MTTVAITVPFMRTSLVHIPRRDLVLAAGDSLSLRMTVIESDRYDADILVLPVGLGGPVAQFSVWADVLCAPSYDYGMCCTTFRTQPLWSSMGTPVSGLGAFDFALPPATMVRWPGRCSWGVQFGEDSSNAELLVAGRLSVRQFGVAFVFPVLALTTDDRIPVHTDINQQVLV